MNEQKQKLIQMADLCAAGLMASNSSEEQIQKRAKEVLVDLVVQECIDGLNLSKTEGEALKMHLGVNVPLEETDEVPCKTHPDAPHGFDRNSSLSEDRYVCECEYWEPPTPTPIAWLSECYNDDNEFIGYTVWDRDVGESSFPVYREPPKDNK